MKSFLLPPSARPCAFREPNEEIIGRGSSFWTGGASAGISSLEGGGQRIVVSRQRYTLPQSRYVDEKRRDQNSLEGHRRSAR
jgi:hypothetical protein